MIDASFASKRNEQLTIKTDSHFWRQMLISWFQVTRPQVGNWSLARLLDSASGSTTTHSLIKKNKGSSVPIYPVSRMLSQYFWLCLYPPFDYIELYNCCFGIWIGIFENSAETIVSDNRSKVPLIASNLCGGTIRYQSVLSVITRDVTLENAANTFARSI